MEQGSRTPSSGSNFPPVRVLDDFGVETGLSFLEAQGWQMLGVVTKTDVWAEIKIDFPSDLIQNEWRPMHT